MPYTGLTAKLVVDFKKGESEVEKKTIAYISNWSIDETRDVVEITELGKATKNVKPTLFYWSGSAEGAVDFESGNNSGHKDLRLAMENGDSVDMYFYLGTSLCLKGKAVITALSFGASAEDKSTISISVTGDGALTLEEDLPQPVEGGAGA